MATDTPIGTRIRKRRQVLGMTQRELAGRLGVSASTVANWETGKHFPLRYLGRVEAVLGVSFEGDDEPRFRPVSDELRELIAEQLPGDPETQAFIIAIMEGTASRPGAGRAQQERHPRPRTDDAQTGERPAGQNRPGRG